MMKRILYTRHNGKVTVCCPSQECFDWLSSGGYWAGQPRGFVDAQIERQVSSGISEYAAYRFVRAMQEGGCTTAECYEIIRDRDCGHLGTAHELVEVEDLPDRWFRDAWYRSHNGGPICVDLRKARKIHFRKLRNIVERENEKRKRDLASFDKLIEPHWGLLRDKIMVAEDEAGLRQIWLEGIKG